MVPSENAIAAGPSHASVSIDWYWSQALRLVVSTSFLSHGSGSSIDTARMSERPFMEMNSSMLSSMAESEPSPLKTGRTFSRSAPMTGEYRCGSRARAQLTLQRNVLISPLWTM